MQVRWNLRLPGCADPRREFSLDLGFCMSFFNCKLFESLDLVAGLL